MRELVDDVFVEEEWQDGYEEEPKKRRGKK